MTDGKDEVLKRHGNSIKKGKNTKKGSTDLGLDKVVPVRLPLDKWERMRQEAKELAIGPTTLARILILDGLRKLGNNSESE